MVSIGNFAIENFDGLNGDERMAMPVYEYLGLRNTNLPTGPFYNYLGKHSRYVKESMRGIADADRNKITNNLFNAMVKNRDLSFKGFFDLLNNSIKLQNDIFGEFKKEYVDRQYVIDEFEKLIVGE